MKAQVLKEPAPVEKAPLAWIEVEKPRPGPRDLLIRVRACGVCLTDKHICEGEIPPHKSPIIPGHQVVGQIEEVGINVDNYRVGERVGIMWLHETCQICDYCLSGRENLCFSAKFSGYDIDGGYAEYALVRQEYAVALPESLSDEAVAPLLCAGIVGYRSYKLCEIKPGGRLGLYGFGAAAHIVIQVARYFECEVSVFTRGESHRKLAKSMGASFAGSADDSIEEPLDSAIIFAPAGDLVPKALGHLKRGGVLAINAIHTSPIPEMPYEKIYYEKTVRSVSHATRQDAEELITLAAEIPIQTKTTSFPMKEANQVLQKIKKSQIDGSAVLIP